jgi:hypothetical protein
MCYALEEKYWGQLKVPLLLGLGRWHKVRSYWEDAEEHIGNNQKSKHPHPLTKETWMHAASPHWLQGFFLPTYVLCHFWHSLMEGAWTSRTSFSCYGCTFRPLPVFVISNMECSLYPEPLTYTWKNGQYPVRDYSNATTCVQFSKKLKLAHFLTNFYNFDT